MISTYDRLKNRLLAYVYPDNKDPSEFHVDFLGVIRAFKEFGILIPPQQLEETLQLALKLEVENKVPAGNVGRRAIVDLILNISYLLSVEEEVLVDRLKELRGATHPMPGIQP